MLRCRDRLPDAGRVFFRAITVTLLLGAPLALALAPAPSSAQSASTIKERNIGASRSRATQLPRSEGDQAIADGWPLYRTERGQTAFNDAMATLKATDGAAPAADAFKGCTGLDCNLTLPALSADGWYAPGRIWVSPAEYVLIVHSPRLGNGQSYRRRSSRDMRYFVYHEFHNSSRNTDPYDTISSHSGSVYVPLYMSKPGTDAQGRRYVIVVQVAPYDVVSVHASNMGSAGAGIEVAKNVTDQLEPLQGLAGILVATIAKAAAPQLKVINHRGAEGQPMLSGYERRLSSLRSRADAPSVTLPFVPAPAQRVAAATGRLEDLISRGGASPRIPIAERGIIPPRAALAAASAPSAAPMPTAPARTAAAPATAPAWSPLASYLIANLATMKSQPGFAKIIPDTVASIAEESPTDGVVYLLDASRQVLGRIEAYQEDGVPVQGKYVYGARDRAIEDETPFALDFSKPVTVRSASLSPTAASGPEPALVGPVRRATRPTR